MHNSLLFGTCGNLEIPLLGILFSEENEARATRKRAQGAGAAL